MSNHVVYRCEYEPSVVSELFYISYGDKITMPLEECPEGTVLADRVKLLCKVDHLD